MKTSELQRQAKPSEQRSMMTSTDRSCVAIVSIDSSAVYVPVNAMVISRFIDDTGSGYFSINTNAYAPVNEPSALKVQLLTPTMNAVSNSGSTDLKSCSNIHGSRHAPRAAHILHSVGATSRS